MLSVTFLNRYSECRYAECRSAKCHCCAALISCAIAGSAKANGRESRSSLGRVINFKLGRFVTYAIVRHIQTRPRPEFKTQPWFCPVSLSLSMALSMQATALAECM
jgi:hypothetical protein